MSTVRILLEVASTDERTPQELADIAAGRLTSCLGVDQSVQEPVKVAQVLPPLASNQRAELVVWEMTAISGNYWNCLSQPAMGAKRVEP